MAAVVAVLAAVLFHFVANVCWLARYDVPPSWDWAIHLTKSLRYSDLAREGRWLELRDVDDYYPPLSRLPAALAYPAFGRNESVGVLANFFWFAVLIAAVYALASRFGNGWPAGAAAVFFVSFTPFLYNYTRFYALVIPTTAAAAAALWALARSDDLKRPGASLFFGVILGLALMVKWTVVAFVLPAAIWAALGPTSSGAARGRRAVHLAGAAVAAAAVAAPWYLRHLCHLVRAARHTAVEAVAQGDPAVFTRASFTHYVSAAIYQLGIVMFAVGLLALVYCIVRRRPGWTILLLWIVGSYLVLTLARNKDYRFTAPMLPAFGVAFGLAFADIRRLPLRYALGGAGVVYALVIFAVTSFGFAGFPPRYVLKPFRIRLIVYDSERPRRENWHVTSLLGGVYAWEKSEDTRPNLCVIPNVATFTEATFRYYAMRDRLNVNIFRPREDFPNFCDLIIVKDGDQGDYKGREAFAKIRDKPSWLRNGYAVARSCRLPDGSSAALYLREVRPRPGFTLAPTEVAEMAARAFSPLLEDVEVAALELEPTACEKGKFERIGVKVRAATLDGLPVSNVDVTLRDVVINPWAAPEVHIMRLGSLSFRFRASFADAARKFERACPGFENTAMSANEGRLSATSTFNGIPVFATAAFADGGRFINVRFFRASIYGISLPAFLLRYVNTQIAPLADRERLPFAVGPVGLRNVSGHIEVAGGGK